jgi:hypothetical protein
MSKHFGRQKRKQSWVSVYKGIKRKKVLAAALKRMEVITKTGKANKRTQIPELL